MIPLIFLLLIISDGVKPQKSELVIEGVTLQTVLVGCRILKDDKGTILRVVYYIKDATGVKKYLEKNQSSIEVIYPKPTHFPAIANRKIITFRDICFPPGCFAEICGKIIGPVLDEESKPERESPESIGNQIDAKLPDRYGILIPNSKVDSSLDDCKCPDIKKTSDFNGFRIHSFKSLIPKRKNAKFKFGSGDWGVSRIKRRLLANIVEDFMSREGSYYEGNTVYYKSCDSTNPFALPAIKPYCIST